MSKQNSKVLMLMIGSNHKRKGGTNAYDYESSVTTNLTASCADVLLEGRRSVMRLILRAGITRHNYNDIRIADLPPNRQLVDGPEFGGKSFNGLYLPAAKRFCGRFFSELGPKGSALLLNSQHHMLFVTGLYGLTTPSESIQDHNIHIDDHPRMRKIWTENDRLTEVLLEYIDRLGITHVFDLTAQNSYRYLIAWERVRARTKSILHCFGDETVGSDFLVTLGQLSKKLIQLTERELMSIHAGASVETPLENVFFEPSSRPPEHLPREIERSIIDLNISDELGRMRRCIISICDLLAGHLDAGDEEGVQRRIRELTKHDDGIPTQIAQCMLNITRIRNSVEYDMRYQISRSRLESVRRDYRDIKEWANVKGLLLSDECLEI